MSRTSRTPATTQPADVADLADLAALPEPILVVGGYGYRNVGDEAILGGLLQLLAGRRVSVVSRLPAETAALHRLRAVPIGAAIPELRRHRSVLIGGGGLFGPDMGALGRLLPAFGLLAAAAGKTVALHGVGVDAGGPYPPAFRALVQRAPHVQVRDRTSAELLARWGVAATVGPDPSTWLPAASPAAGAALLRAAGLRLTRPIVGVSLTAVRPALGTAAVEAVAAAMDALPETQFCFVPMSQHPFVARHNDLLLAARLLARQPRLRILDGWHHPAQFVAAYGHLSTMVGMRYHALLFAERAGIPLVAVPYADKCRSWLAEHGMAEVESTAEALTAALRRALFAVEPTPARRAAS